MSEIVRCRLISPTGGRNPEDAPVLLSPTTSNLTAMQEIAYSYRTQCCDIQRQLSAESIATAPFRREPCRSIGNTVCAMHLDVCL